MNISYGVEKYQIIWNAVFSELDLVHLTPIYFGSGTIRRLSLTLLPPGGGSWQPSVWVDPKHVEHKVSDHLWRTLVVHRQNNIKLANPWALSPSPWKWWKQECFNKIARKSPKFYQLRQKTSTSCMYLQRHNPVGVSSLCVVMKVSPYQESYRTPDADGNESYGHKRQISICWTYRCVVTKLTVIDTVAPCLF